MDSLASRSRMFRCFPHGLRNRKLRKKEEFILLLKNSTLKLTYFAFKRIDIRAYMFFFQVAISLVHSLS